MIQDIPPQAVTEFSLPDEKTEYISLIELSCKADDKEFRAQFRNIPLTE